MSAEIREDDSIAGRKCFGDREPEFVVDGKGVEEDDRMAVAEGPVDDFGVIGFQAVVRDRRHGGIKTYRGGGDALQ